MRKRNKIILWVAGIMSFIIICLAVLADLGGYIDIGLFRKRGSIYLNDNLVKMTLPEVIAAAEPGDIVEISGTVYTKPVEVWTDNLTIAGRGGGAKIELTRGYWRDIENKVDVLTLNGDTIILRDVTVDAGFRVDHPVRILQGRNVTLENVTTRRGMRSALDILNGENHRFINVRAADSWQSGVCINSDVDGAGLYFENVSTRGNWRAGVLVRNYYGSAINIDLGGITVHEGTWATEFRHGNLTNIIEITHPPVNRAGETIEMQNGRDYNVERKYKHTRYGKRDVGRRIFFMF
jgi:hypothetical protein